MVAHSPAFVKSPAEGPMPGRKTRCFLSSACGCPHAAGDQVVPVGAGHAPVGVFQISGLHNTNRSSSMSKACLTPYRGRRMSSTADAVAFWSARLARSARTLACADFCGSKRPAGQARTPEDGYSPPKGCNELTQKVEIHPPRSSVKVDLTFAGSYAKFSVRGSSAANRCSEFRAHNRCNNYRRPSRPVCGGRLCA